MSKMEPASGLNFKRVKIQNDTFLLKNDTFLLKNDTFLLKNDTFLLKNCQKSRIKSKSIFEIFKYL